MIATPSLTRVITMMMILYLCTLENLFHYSIVDELFAAVKFKETLFFGWYLAADCSRAYNRFSVTALF